MSNLVAIFVITYNRSETLIRTLESYKKFTTPHEVIIINNGTDNEECINVLNNLKYFYKIYDMPKISEMTDFDININNVITDYYNNNTAPYFAISDCDVCFENSEGDTLDLFIEMINKTGHAIGPNLLINNLHPNYPLRNYVIRHNCLLFKKENNKIYDFKNKKIPYIDCPIDSTFIIFPRCKEFNRLKRNTLRINGNYAASHLDWYIDFINPSKENIIYANKNCSIGGYGGSFIKSFLNLFISSKLEAFNYINNDVKLKLNQNKLPTLNMYILSWMHQYGYGCEIDMEKSRHYLLNAEDPNQAWGYNPKFGSRYYLPAEEFIKMVYNNDFNYLEK